MLQPGDVLQQRYAIESLIGQGGMGRVYVARQTMLGRRRLAIKEIKLDHVRPDERPEAIIEFLREAETLAMLSHPNLIDVKDCFVENGELFLAMEYVDGETLEAIASRHPRGVPVDTALEWARQLCTVLAYLHNTSPPIIFKDLKPANIMLDSNGVIRLVDFGIAERVRVHAEAGDDYALQGTPGYAPIEQLVDLDHAPDARSDVYGLGAVLYHVLTGQRPVDARERLADDPLVAPNELNPALPQWLSAAVANMLSLRWDDRFPSAVQVREWLDREDAHAVHFKPIEQPAELPPPITTLMAWWEDPLGRRTDVHVLLMEQQKLTFLTRVGQGRLPRELCFKGFTQREPVKASVRLLSATPHGEHVLCEGHLMYPPLNLVRMLRDATRPDVRLPSQPQQRRRVERLEVSLAVVTRGEVARAVDISSEGMRLVTLGPVPLGTHVPVTVVLQDVVLPDLDLLGEIRWCRARWGGGYESGMRWVEGDSRWRDALSIYLSRLAAERAVTA